MDMKVFCRLFPSWSG